MQKARKHGRKCNSLIFSTFEGYYVVRLLDPYFLAFTPLLPSNRPIYNQLSHRECFIYLHDHYNDVYFRKITDKLKTLSIDVPICWEY